jgi:DNA repair photolyase
MIHEIQAKTLLQHVKKPDSWFGLHYGLNIYRGCQHHCIYCDSRSECYQIEAFDRDVLVKVNAPDLLDRELAHKRIKGVIGTGSMNDAYMPLEAELGMTRRVLQVIAQHGFGVHIITKSCLVERDIDLLLLIKRFYTAVSFTITTADDDLGKILEPGASLVSERLRAMKALSRAGIRTGVTLMPVLPFIEDQPENIIAILEKAAACGASYVIPAFGVTLRDRQREYFYNQLDRHFPGLSERYHQAYGNRYSCDVPNSTQLYRVFADHCRNLGLLDHLDVYVPAPEPVQISFNL